MFQCRSLGLFLECVELLELVFPFLSSNLMFHPFSYISSVPLSLSSIMCMLGCLMVSHRFLRLSSLSFIFLFVPRTWYYQITCLQVLWFFLLSDQVSSCTVLVNFSIQLSLSSVPEFVWFFLIVCLSIDILILFMLYFPAFFNNLILFLVHWTSLRQNCF